MDVARVGTVAAALMDRLAEDEDGDAELGEVMILAEVRNEGEHPWTQITYRCSDPREWVQRGMLHAALDDDRVPDEDDEE